MNRRSFGLSALYCAALLIGTLAGGAVNVPSASANPPAHASHASQSPPAPSVVAEPAQAPAKRAPPVVCKTTKDCPQDHICGKVDDHKECTPTLVKVPRAPMVT